MWILSGYYYPSAIPAKFRWGRVRVKHSNILIVICTYCKYVNVNMENAACIFFALIFPNRPLFLQDLFFCQPIHDTQR